MVGSYAILVEDEDEPAQLASQMLRESGFEVTLFDSFESAIDGIGDVGRPVDVVILDRRLPRTSTDEPAEEVGDQLLDEMLLLLPDTPFVVFTGYTGFEHSQFVTGDRGVIALGRRGEHIDRVKPFKKGQTLELEHYLGKLSSHVSVMADIEIEDVATVAPDGMERRLLRRIACYYGGAKIRASSLLGGLSESPVWRCEILSELQQPVAMIVVKLVDTASKIPSGGFHNLLPAPYIAAPGEVITGLCDGKSVQVLQLVDRHPTSLYELLIEDDARAADALRDLNAVITSHIEGQQRSLSLEELVSPFLPWNKLVELSSEFGISVPRPTVRATSSLAPQHGDLHPGNILMSGNRPVVIDFDSETLGGRPLDAVTALLAPIFHKLSPIRGHEWPHESQCRLVDTPDFLDGCPCPKWIKAAQAWMLETTSSPREQWGLIFGFAIRQLKFGDVKSDDLLLARVKAIAQAALDKLSE